MEYKNIMKNQKRAVSIGQRLRKLETKDEKRKEVVEWLKKWDREQHYIVQRVENAVNTDNYDQIIIGLGELRAMSIRRLETFDRIRGVMAE